VNRKSSRLIVTAALVVIVVGLAVAFFVTR